MHINEFERVMGNGPINSRMAEDILRDHGINNDMLGEELGKSRIKAEKLLKDPEKIEKVLKKAKQFCRMLSNIPFVGGFFKDVSTLCDIISDKVTGKYPDLPLATLLSLLAAILYMISPIDVIPDAVPLLGVIDDFTILGMVMKAAKNDIETYTAWKQNRVFDEEV